MDSIFEDAVCAWQDVLGTQNVSIDRSDLALVERATYYTEQRLLAKLRPENREQVQECLRIANRYDQKIYSVSAGENWGYGSSVPVISGTVLMDLSRLQQISDYDDQLGTVTVEPGVSQNALYEFLQAQGGRFWMDVTGASPNSSIIGNVMERGFGHSPYGERITHISAMEVVLPTGECIHTGFGRFSNALAKHIYPWGIGPSLDGLFSQSNLGVVTKLTFWLLPVPDYFQAYYFSVAQNDNLGPLIEILRPLRLGGVIKSAVHIGNAYRVLSSIQQYPWEATGGKTPLPPAVLEAFSKKWDFGAWNGSGGLYGTREEVRVARRQIKRALNGIVKKVQFLDAQTLAWAERWQEPLQWLKRVDVPQMLKLVRPVFDMMQGRPTEHFIASAYWRKKLPISKPMHPDRDRCGLLWCGPLAPATAQHALEMASIAEDTVFGYGYEPAMTMTLLTERSLENIISIAYDRDVAGEDERAMACYSELLARLTQKGYYPYRLGIHSMRLSGTGEESYSTLLKNLKSQLDPNQVLSSQRYIWM